MDENTANTQDPDLLSVNEVELVYKSNVPASKRLQVHSAEDAHKIFKANWSNQIGLVEEFNILLLNHRHHVLGMSNIAKGGIAQVNVDLRIAFAIALKGKATAMILAHNHPTGDLTPSSHDIQLTTKFLEAGKIIDIKIIDHIILSPEENFYSFADDFNLE